MLLVDAVDKFPFPKEVAGLAQYVKWDEQTWNAFGLPAFDSKFSITSGQLYLDQNQFGEFKVHKSDFTGEVGISTVIINPRNCGQVFLLTFKAVFFKGALSEVTFFEAKTSNYSEYQLQHDKLRVEMLKRQKTTSSFWFHYLYKPYHFLLKMIGAIILVPLSIAIHCVIWLLESMAFIKI